MKPARFWTIFIAFSVLLLGFSVDSLPSAEAIKASGTYLTGTSSTGTDKIVCGDKLCGESPMSTLEKILIYLDEKSKQQDSAPLQENAFSFGGVLVSAGGPNSSVKISGIETGTITTSQGLGTAGVMVNLDEIFGTGSNSINVQNLKVTPELVSFHNQDSFSINLDLITNREIMVDTLQIAAPQTSIFNKLNEYSIGIFSEDDPDIFVENLQLDFAELNYANGFECCTLRISTDNLHLQLNQVTSANSIQIKTVKPHTAAVTFDGAIKQGRLYLPASGPNESEIMTVGDVFYVSQIISGMGETISFDGPIIVGYNVEETVSKHLFGKVRLYHYSDGIWEDITLEPGLITPDLPASWNLKYTTVGITSGITSENTFGTFVAGIPLEN